VNAAESMKIFESFQEEFPEESKKSEVNAIIGNEIASELTKLEALGYQDAIETGCRLMEKHEILKARKCFNHIVTLLEKERSSEKTFPINNELIAKAYTYRGLAYMVGSPSHREQVLSDFEKAIKMDPTYSLPREKKEEYELEIGVLSPLKIR
jgi:hypothetical protein